jgi:hypothetical protein
MTDDERWGGYIPWFLRKASLPGSGDFQTFFSRVGQCLERWFNERRFTGMAAVSLTGLNRNRSLDEFSAWLETESFQRYRHDPRAFFPLQIRRFFDPFAGYSVAQLADWPVVQRCLVEVGLTQEESAQIHLKRLGVLEIILKSIPLDLEVPPEFRPLDEPLLQREVIDQLLPRLEARFPERARELIAAYHDVVSGQAPDIVFKEAFATLEAIVRDLTGDSKFIFDQAHLDRHFGMLHGTIHQTLIKLAPRANMM